MPLVFCQSIACIDKLFFLFWGRASEQQYGSGENQYCRDKKYFVPEFFLQNLKSCGPQLFRIAFFYSFCRAQEQGDTVRSFAYQTFEKSSGGVFFQQFFRGFCGVFCTAYAAFAGAEGGADEGPVAHTL